VGNPRVANQTTGPPSQRLARAKSSSDRVEAGLAVPGAPSSDRSTTASGRRPGYCLQTPGELPSVKPNSGSTAIMLFWPSVKTHRIVPRAAATAVGVEMAKFD
jgi:hypothetical protein